MSVKIIKKKVCIKCGAEEGSAPKVIRIGDLIEVTCNHNVLKEITVSCGS